MNPEASVRHAAHIEEKSRCMALFILFFPGSALVEYNWTDTPKRYHLYVATYWKKLNGITLMQCKKDVLPPEKLLHSS